MKSIRIYLCGQFEAGQATELDKPASHHLLRVLRLKNKQTLTLFNGEGYEYSARLEISGKTAIAHIESANEISHESGLKIHLLQGISKGDRMDLVIQKSIELGVNKITPIVCDRTVVNLKGDRADKKLSHWKSIAISACEQCGRNFLPHISEIKKMSDSLQSETNQLKLFLDPLSTGTLKDVTPNSEHITLLIGPEGGLTDSEIEFAKENGFSGIQLGPRVLRTETAALAAITATQLLWGDLN